MKALKVVFSEINLAMRFDSSYHLSEGTVYLRKLRKMPHDELDEITSNIFTAGRSKRVYTEEKYGYPYLSNSDVVKQNPLDGCKYNSKKYGYDEASFLKEGIIVTGRVGAIGQTAYITSELEEFKSMGSDNIIRIVPNKDEKSGYIYAFLASKFGNTLLWRLAAGGVQPYISEDMLRDMPIPKLAESKKEEIHNLIVEASNLRVEANKLLRDARGLFYNELEVSIQELEELNRPLEREVSSSFKISMGEFSAYTFRGRNYSPRKQKIIDVLSKGKHESLRDVLITDPFYGARYKRIESYSSNSVELLSQGNIFDLKPKGRSIAKKSIKNLDQEIVAKGTILVPAQGTLGENEIFGRAKFVWGYLEGKVIAGHAMRFVPDEDKISSGYLFTVLNSPLWFRLFRNTVYGTNLLGFIVPLINDLPIPRIKSSIEASIDLMVKQAYEKLTKGNEIEYQAIELIENEIESWQKS